MTGKWVYSFCEGKGDWRDLLGGKGAGLAEMTNAGLPVPPGFTITTQACVSYMNEGRFPEGMWEQVIEALREIERAAGKEFGGKERPLLVSVRSGAKFSMPGMMDTVLNLGLNDVTVEGLIQQTGNPRFAYDAYRRFVALFGRVVMGIDSDLYEHKLQEFKDKTGAKADVDLTAETLKEVVAAFKEIVRQRKGLEFPSDASEQLRRSIQAVFESWNSERAVAYRNVNKIPHDLGTAVNVQAMVFGNMGNDSGTGVAFTRNPSTGEKELFGEYLLNAQGEDVVAGVRTPRPIAEMKDDNNIPAVYDQFLEIAQRLEKHYLDAQDLEFTVEKGKLYMLQTRSAKRTGRAAVKVAVDMVQEGLIDKSTAVRRVAPDQLDQLLHPTIAPDAKVRVLATGLPASPGAASGKVVFTAEEAIAMVEGGEKVILVRTETSPEDFPGMVAAQAILTARGGMTSHAAVVARGMGKVGVVGAEALRIDYKHQQFSVDKKVIQKGDFITVDGSTGRVLLGVVPTIEPEIGGDFKILMGWADEFRRLGVRANADTPHDAITARSFGAQGIGLCRTEHMFFEGDRIDAMREMIVADTLEDRKLALDKLLPLQKSDFVGIFTAMNGFPVTIRTLDPPLHEFLPHEQHEIIDLARKMGVDPERLIAKVNSLREANPMLGFRGCRLGLVFPEITEMQARAVFQAAIECTKKGIVVLPEIMIPLVGHVNELALQREIVDRVAREEMGNAGVTVEYKVGTMVELPRAALTADQIATQAEFFSFGTNDLTQTTFGISRDDIGKFLPYYLEHKIYKDDPFQVLDRQGVGQLMEIGTTKGRSTRSNLKVGICGEHGGEPSSVEFCHRIGLDYVSCSPYRVPIARLSAAQAALETVDRDK
ncbi:MAG: pyruvate, phosphate dikinase [Chloroflexi bacterium]|nr:pyruvate, phosphate dikinase [Chloroflexota bacterium]